MTHLVWFRHDLRVLDNAALTDALAAGPTVGCFCICEKQWREHHVGDRRLAFLLRTLQALHRELQQLNVPLRILRTPTFGDVADALARLFDELDVSALYFNEEYPLNERRRDIAVAAAAERRNIRLRRYAGSVTLPPGTVLTQDGRPYTVYTPFRRRWGELVDPAAVAAIGRPGRQTIAPGAGDPLPSAFDGVSGDVEAEAWPAGERVAAASLARFIDARAARYDKDRDLPAIHGTSQLAQHLSVGSISPNQCLAMARDANGGQLAGHKPGINQWVNEIVWREFYRHIVAQFDHVSQGHAFRLDYDRLRWRDTPAELLAWQEGRTGYPLVDAAMRCLVATGWMHNRLRMVCAMFLSKHLLIDWRAGERFFFERLVDGDPASNNGGWQWAASTGTDAQPYFRIFNPVAQGRRWDPEGRYVRRWIPELRDVPDAHVHAPWECGLPPGYPPPIVDHAERRELALERFRSARERAARR